MPKHTIVFWAVLIVCMLSFFLFCLSGTFPIPIFSDMTRGSMAVVLGVLMCAAAVELYLALNSKGDTDGVLVAGVEDEDGLVFSLKTPVEKLVQKDRITFDVLREEKKEGAAP